MLFMGANFNDTVELWLEAIRYAGEGFHVEVLAGAISKPDSSQESSDHILVWVERPLNAAQKARQAAWLEKGVPLAVTGPGVKPLIKPKGVGDGLPITQQPAASQNPAADQQTA